MLTYSWPSRCYKPECYQHGLVTEPVCSGTRSWWRHQMKTLSAQLAICAGNSPVTGEFTAQRPVTRSFDVFFDLRLNKWLSKQWWCWWVETPSRPLWCHCNISQMVEYLDLYSLCRKTPYHQISWNLEAARLDVIMIVSLWNLTGIK